MRKCEKIEIDREALAEALFMFVKNHDNEKTSVSDDIKDFISTMPTWLRKVNKRTQRNENARITRLSR